MRALPGAWEGWCLLHPRALEHPFSAEGCVKRPCQCASKRAMDSGRDGGRGQSSVQWSWPWDMAMQLWGWEEYGWRGLTRPS